MGCGAIFYAYGGVLIPRSGDRQERPARAAPRAGGPWAVHPRRCGSEAATGRLQPAADIHNGGGIASAHSPAFSARVTFAPAPAAASPRG
jgi:hypothetical protein